VLYYKRMEVIMELNANMDANLLLSLINTKLRNDYNNLMDLCASEDIPKDLIVKRLELIDYYYNSSENQFKPK